MFQNFRCHINCFDDCASLGSSDATVEQPEGLDLLLDVDQNFAGWADPLKMIVDGVGVREAVVGVLGVGVGWKQLLGA